MDNLRYLKVVIGYKIGFLSTNNAGMFVIMPNKGKGEKFRYLGTAKWERFTRIPYDPDNCYLEPATSNQITDKVLLSILEKEDPTNFKIFEQNKGRLEELLGSDYSLGAVDTFMGTFPVVIAKDNFGEMVPHAHVFVGEQTDLYDSTPYKEIGQVSVIGAQTLYHLLTTKSWEKIEQLIKSAIDYLGRPEKFIR